MYIFPARQWNRPLPFDLFIMFTEKYINHVLSGGKTAGMVHIIEQTS